MAYIGLRLVAGGLAVLMLGCQSSANPGLQGTRWVLREMKASSATAVPVSAGITPAITATFTEAQISGSSGCNSYSASYGVSGKQLAVSNLQVTRRACTDPKVMERERTYLGAIEGTNRYELQRGQLVIYSSQQVDLVFSPELEERSPLNLS